MPSLKKENPHLPENRDMPLKARSPERTKRVEEVLQRKQPDLTVVMEDVDDPHNIMAILRTCDAVGVFEVHIVDSQKKKWDNRIGKNSSSGAKKWIVRHKYSTIDDCYKQLRKEGKTILTTHMAEDSKDLYELDFSGPIALVFGNEHDGITKEAVEKADGNFIIPQMGMIRSLNVSVACAVTLYEVYRQRALKGHYSSAKFSSDELMSLRAEWLEK